MTAPIVVRRPAAIIAPVPKAKTPHQKAEGQLSRYGLTLPETDLVPAWPPARCLRVRKRMFFMFGPKPEPLDALTLIMKLPISAEMVQDLPFVRESKGWYKQHNWVIASFGPEDDILAEMDTLKGWMRQSYCAMAPKKLARQVL